jgi:spore germination protein GerM
MTRARILQLAGGVLLLAVLAWGATVLLERVMQPESVAGPVAAVTAPEAGVPRITATLYYGAPDGQGLVAVRREVPLAEAAVPQGRAILDALLADAAPEPYVKMIPDGTTIRAFYVTERGEAFVDFSPDIASGHPGGSFAELLTVYAIVNTITANLPSVQRVQILINGAEADTLAGHVDLRRPLTADLTLVTGN